MRKLRFSKWGKPFCFLYLFVISIFSPSLLANPFEFPNYLPPDSEDILLISVILGLIISTFTYYYQKEKRGKFKSSRNLIQVFLIDFWFDEFVLLKFTTFIYFLSLTSFYTYIIAGLIMYVQTGILYFLLMAIITAPAILIVTRVILEFSIAIIKIAENSSRINDKEDKEDKENFEDTKNT